MEGNMSMDELFTVRHANGEVRTYNRYGQVVDDVPPQVNFISLLREDPQVLHVSRLNNAWNARKRKR